jgi:glucosamine kinase
MALDAGGTSTRAVVLDSAGHAYGYGRSGVGNPTAAGVRDAVNAIGLAAEQAMAGLAASEPPALALIAMAGEKTPAFRGQVTGRLAAMGVPQVVLDHDLLGIFHSGTAARDGYALIAGTGTVAARIRGGRLDRVVGGKGWLLGDAGGGFWIGHAVARAVVASLDGQAQDTALTGLVLDAMGIEADTTTVAARAGVLRQLVSALYALPPIFLAEFAPLAFAAHEDQVARPILVGVSSARRAACCRTSGGSARSRCGRRQHHRPRHAGCATQPPGRACSTGRRRSGDSGYGRTSGCGSAGCAACGTRG